MTKRIDDSLARIFAQQRLVFWYDPEGQWGEAFAEFESGSVTKLRVEGNELAAKVAIHRDPDSASRYLLYFPSARPKDVDNWLLDLLLQGHEFKADRASLILQDAGLPYEFRPVVEQHISFFSAKRTEALRQILSAGEDARTVRLKMVAVLVGAEPEVDALLLAFFGKRSADMLLDPVEESLGSANLVAPFWKEVGVRFGYTSDAPSLRDFATTLFRWANPLDSGIELDSHARVFMQWWKDSQVYRSAFREWSDALEADLHVVAKLNSAEDVRLVEKSDTFRAFEKFIIHGLCRAFDQGKPGSVLAGTINARRSSFWFSDHEAGYEALAAGIELRELLGSAELSVESLDAGVTRYVASWHRVDAAYRRFCLHQRRYGQPAVLGCVTRWVEKAYVNNFLLPLADRWSDQLRGVTVWGCGRLPAQANFFGEFVRPFVDKGQKLFVVVSDALRYEAGAELAGRIRTENRWTADLEAVLSPLPSYTQLGMASLLPGDQRSVQPSDGSVVVDGKNAAGTEARKQILASALEGRATAIQAETFLEMNTKTEGRALMRDNEVIYVFHNTIDKVGDSPATEAKTAEAVETAINELMQILKKIANVNGTHMLVTADHGFLFQQSEVSEADDLPLPAADEWLFKNRRFALGRKIAKNPTVKVFAAEDLGLAGDWQAAFPLSLGRFPLSGSGKRYVHGGVSLQEVVVPVVRVHKARSDDTGRVEVDFMRLPSKITTGQLSLSLYQDEPVNDKILPRALSLGVYALDGKPLSEVRSLIFDSADEEPRLRERTIGLTLSRSADKYNGQEVEIRLEEIVPGTTQTAVYKSHKVKVQKPFESDFDD